MDAQFEHLCRICAANTKCKNNSVVESVFIFKTLGLKDKIARHLFLDVAEDDPLPKVLCKSCYRQVEATASLSNIAKHTQRVFRDFLLSTVPKHAREATAAKLNAPTVAHVPHPTPVQDIRESNHSVRNHSTLDNDTFQPIMLTRPPETTITLAGNQKRDEIVVSLPRQTNKDSEMCQQPKPQCVPSTEATQYTTNNRGNLKINNLMLPTRRNSVFGDTRYSSAPMSIAQRSMQQPPSLAPLHPEMSLSKIPKKSPEKRNSPAGVINFIQTHGRITGTTTAAPSITTRTNKDYKDEEIRRAMNIRNQPTAPSSTLTSTSAPTATTQVANNVAVTNLPTSVLQQKRRNLKNALSNISAIRDGQVSLLKSSQPRQTVEEIDIRPLVTTTVVPHLSLYGSEQSVEEALPEHIIIAAPKKKKEEFRQGPPKLQKITTIPTKKAQSSSDASPQTSSAIKSNSPPSMSSLTDAISLGNVIRDPDLLMLILKALKWPVTNGNCEEQMARLKNSKFAVIMSDSNLLQDTDLTQLLGPYLGPLMNVGQQQQKQSSSTNTKTPSPSVSPTQNKADLQKIGDCTMYKLPPETSVQLVPSSPTDQEPPPSKPLGSISKRPHRKSRAPPEYFIDTPATETTTSNAAHVTKELLNINAMLISQFGSNPADALNEALISMLKQQQQQKSKSQRHNSRRSRSASTTSAPINLEDIILIEPEPPQLTESASPKSDGDVNTCKMPSQKLPEPPLITRPVIKRRKVVMQTSEQISGENNPCRDDQMPIAKKNEDNATKTELEQCKDKETATMTKTTTTSISVPSKNVEILSSQPVMEVPQAPTSTVAEAIPSDNLNHQEVEVESATDDGAASPASAAKDVIPNKSTATNVRKTDVKSALGQKLLEAIGLPQPGKDVPPESSRDTLRSALKRSLKQAQEQQQQLKRVKQEEPVKQMADSTTKTGAGESSEEHKKAIAERELELLKRKAKIAEKNNLSTIKDEKSERMDVSSSSSRNRRSRNKSKTDALEEDSGVEEKKSERWDEDDDLPLKSELEKSTEHINRPTRTSKTMSKYYKSPGNDKASSVQKSQHAMGTRSARQR
ncbi:muscle M-line assembly protein unc-89 [Drosophila innubila]|uniref:muscle M-line assembly protein unc-89 n=1 Tax=Drosophila innubila TaxID=198719 RepID=UPI00148DD1B0|nr:muscle M-line assembly protein unc-89 [Drosophila innubila]